MGKEADSVNREENPVLFDDAYGCPFSGVRAWGLAAALAIARRQCRNHGRANEPPRAPTTKCF